jgi:VanZ family protein
MTTTTIRRLMILWLVLVAVAVVLSLWPAMAPPGSHGLDKVAHIVAFFGLAAIPAAVLPRRVALGLALLFLLAVGAGIEFAQTSIPGRQGSGADMLANAAGILVGALVGRLVAAAGRYLGLLSGPADGQAMSTGICVPNPPAPHK